MLERLAGLAAALVFCGWAVSLLVGGRSKTVSAAEDEAADTGVAGQPESAPKASREPDTGQARTGWRWRPARRDNPPIVSVERIDQPQTQPEPQPPASERPALRAVPDPDPAPDPEGLDPMTIARRAYDLARKRRRQQTEVAKAAARVEPASGKVIPLQARTAEAKPVEQAPTTTAVGTAAVPVVPLQAPAAGQMLSLVETIAEAATLLARIPPGGDIRNPIAQIAAFAQAQARLARAVSEHRQRMAEDHHDGVVLAVIEQAEAITHNAARALADTALTAAFRYQGTASDQAAGTRIPNVNRQ
ncbi:hypothetical protein AB0K18_42635 [Nonomuraea sp. NPDC049421]|uniref:hypothetical protein n=1 Tax=Nonomuraea sp. NPDC049421 TaxID=3155275 RepID=UPI0034252413